MKQKNLDADTLCSGALHVHINNAIGEIRDRVIFNENGRGKGKIVLTIDVDIEDDGYSARVSLKEPKVTKPALRAKGQIVRFIDETPVVDVDEDEDGNQRLPFTVHGN